MIGGVAWVLDAAIKTDGERAAEAFSDFAHAMARGDGEGACERITERSKKETIATETLASGEQSDCPAAVTHQMEQISAVGGPSRDEVADLDAGDIEDNVEVHGNRAVISGREGIANTSVTLVKVDGEWLVDLTASEARIAETLPENPSQEQVIAAADRLCVTAYPRSNARLAEVVDALDRRRLNSVPGLARAWADSERRLAEDLDDLAKGTHVRVLADVIGAQRRKAAAIDALSARPRELLERPDAILAANQAVEKAAAEGGFSKFGCAAPATVQ